MGIADQDEVINKLNKEKKHIAETQAKSNNDMVSVGEKVEHLASVKSKLESTLGDVFFFLVQLVDDLVLVGNLVLEHLDGVITVALLQLNLGNSKLNVFDFLLDDTNAAGVGLNLTRQGNPGAFLRREDCLSIL